MFKYYLIIITTAISYTAHVCSCLSVCDVGLFSCSTSVVVGLMFFRINDTSVIFNHYDREYMKTTHTRPCFRPLLFSPLCFPPSVHRFSVSVEPGTKLESGPASLHLCNNLLVLTRGTPPVTIGHWKLSALRRYGAVPNGFVYEGGTRCGYCK